MRRLSGMLLTGLLVLAPALVQGPTAGYGRVAAQAQKLTFDGDMVLWTVVVKGDKTADFEGLMGKVKEALLKSDKPERKAQAAGWKLIKSPKPKAEGNAVYVQVINVVKDADYTILAILYEANTDPAAQKALYEQYRGALVGAAPGAYSTVLDLSK